MDNRLKELEDLNSKLRPPDELGGVFLPKGAPKQFDIMLIAERPSMNEPLGRPLDENFNFDANEHDRYFQRTMVKCGVGGSYVTDLVKRRNIPGRPTAAEIAKWLPHLLDEIRILQPMGIIVVGKTTYSISFRSVVHRIPRSVEVDWIYYYRRVSRDRFEARFCEVVNNMKMKSNVL